MDKELVEALCGTTLDDLHSDLWRYGGPEYENDEDCKRQFPEITQDLVLKVIEFSDECPCCLHRFINSSGTHSDTCKLGPLLAVRRLGLRF